MVLPHVSMTLYSVRGGVVWRVLLCIVLIQYANAFDDNTLTDDELRTIFGAGRTVPEYSVVVPQFESSSRPRRSVSPGGQQLLIRMKDPSDASLQLYLQALGTSYAFDLQESNGLVSSRAVLVHRYANGSRMAPLDRDTSCLYTGRQGDTKLALNICSNMRGVIVSPSEELIIEPLPEVSHRRRRSANGGGVAPLLVYRRRQSPTPCSSFESTQSSGDRSYLLDRYYPSHSNGRSTDLGSVLSNSASHDDLLASSRQSNKVTKHNVPTIYVETAVFVDQDLAKHMENYFPDDTNDQLIQVVLAMVNAVQLLYSDGSLGVEVHFVLKRLEILHEDPDGLLRPHDIDLFLTNFCRWQKDENPQGDDHDMHWDHALVLTGLDLFTVTTRGRVNAQVVGLAPVAGMCSSSSSCTVNEGRHFESVYVVAHEIGHNLGMRHDGSTAGNSCDPAQHLMSPTLGSGKISWSSCSRRYLEIFLMSDQAECLRDAAVAEPTLDHRGPLLPGQRFNADIQCMLKHGPGSTHAQSQALAEICVDLHCRRDHYTWTSHPALEGTSCGRGMWCRRGQCTKKSHRHRPPSGSALNPHQTIKYNTNNFNNFFDDRTRPHIGPSIGPSIIPSIGPHLALPPSTARPPTVVHRLPHSPNDGGGFDRGSTPSTVPPFIGGDAGWTDCQSSCLYGTDGVLSSGSTGLQSTRRTCSTCRGQLQFRTCSAVRECGGALNRRTLQDYANAVCLSLSTSDKRYSGYAAPVPSSGLPQCRVLCEGSGILDTALSTKWYPDGTVCSSGTGTPAYCVSGMCEEFSCDSNSQYLSTGAHCLHLITGGHGPPPTSSQWGPWQQGSSCRTSCMVNSRGIELVSRQCQKQEGDCTGLSKNIRLCSPTKQECHTMVPVFQHATEVCRKFQKEVTQLSGLGMQLTNTPSDPDRACTVACQDLTLHYRFYRVNGREGWFPFGTDCSGGKEGAGPKHCLNGKCLDFDKFGIPLQNTVPEGPRSRSLHLDLITEDVSDLQLLRSSRQLLSMASAVATDDASVQTHRRDGGLRSSVLQPLTSVAQQQQTRQARLHKQLIDEHLRDGLRELRRQEWAAESARHKRGVESSSHRLPGSIDADFLLTLVDQLNYTLTHENDTETHGGSSDHSTPSFLSAVDLDNPIFADIEPPVEMAGQLPFEQTVHQWSAGRGVETVGRTDESGPTFTIIDAIEMSSNTSLIDIQNNTGMIANSHHSMNDSSNKSYLMENETKFTINPTTSTKRGKSLDFKSSRKPDKNRKLPKIIDGKWKVRKTPCSVTCGQGLTETIVTCEADHKLIKGSKSAGDDRVSKATISYDKSGLNFAVEQRRPLAIIQNSDGSTRSEDGVRSGLRHDRTESLHYKTPYFNNDLYNNNSLYVNNYFKTNSRSPSHNPRYKNISPNISPRKKSLSVPSFSSNSQLWDLVDHFKPKTRPTDSNFARSWRRVRDLSGSSTDSPDDEVGPVVVCKGPPPHIKEGFDRCYSHACASIDPEPSPALSAWLTSLIDGSL